METVATLTEQIRGWYEQSPTARRAYARLRADVVAVADWAGPTVGALRARVGSPLDPPEEPPDGHVPESRTG